MAENSPQKIIGQEMALSVLGKQFIYMPTSLDNNGQMSGCKNKNMEALNSQHCFRFTTLDFTTYDRFPVWPHFPTLSLPPEDTGREGMTSAR